MGKLLIVEIRNFQDTFQTRKQSFISALSICMTVPSRYLNCCPEFFDYAEKQFDKKANFNFKIYDAIK